VPSFQAVVYFLLVWTAVSVPLSLLLAAVIKFGTGEARPPDQIDREFGTPLLVRQHDSVVAEKRTIAKILFFRKTSARQSQESVSSPGASPLADQEAKTALTERAHRQIG
jgi:thymidine phosphorylase